MGRLRRKNNNRFLEGYPHYVIKMLPALFPLYEGSYSPGKINSNKVVCSRIRAGYVLFSTVGMTWRLNFLGSANLLLVFRLFCSLFHSRWSRVLDC